MYGSRGLHKTQTIPIGRIMTPPEGRPSGPGRWTVHRCPRRESGVSAAGLELLLATAVHIVKLVSTVGVLAFAAIEFVLTPATLRKEDIVTISAIENILTLVYAGQGVASVASVENIVALPADQIVVAVRPSVEDIVA